MDTAIKNTQTLQFTWTTLLHLVYVKQLKNQLALHEGMNRKSY